jgi:predicted nucleic acid-binding protein
VIHFDTNALIALPQWARASHPTIRRIVAGEPAAVCSVVWYEFLIGPIDVAEIDLARAFLQGRIQPIDDEDATLAAQLFNDCGRRRTLKTDAWIAASAIRANAEFVTVNVADFEPFAKHGLRLLSAKV